MCIKGSYFLGRVREGLKYHKNGYHQTFQALSKGGVKKIKSRYEYETFDTPSSEGL